VEDSQDAREEVLLPAYRVTGKPEVNFSIADDQGVGLFCQYSGSMENNRAREVTVFYVWSCS
jgi:hypothetical protein